MDLMLTLPVNIFTIEFLNEVHLSLFCLSKTLHCTYTAAIATYFIDFVLCICNVAGAKAIN